MKTLVIVDVQPGYLNHIYFKVSSLLEESRKYDKVIIYFVGEELGMDSLSDMKFFFCENGIPEEEIEDFTFCEKTYGYLRGWMDAGVDDETIVGVLKYMRKNNIWDSRDLPEEYLETALDDIYYPYFEGDPNDCILRFLQDNGEVDICGGGSDECLKEMELFFEAEGIKTKRLVQYIY